MLLPKQSRNYVTGLAAACSLLLIACSSEEVRQVNLIPKPEQMTMSAHLAAQTGFNGSILFPNRNR